MRIFVLFRLLSTESKNEPLYSVVDERKSTEIKMSITHMWMVYVRLICIYDENCHDFDYCYNWAHGIAVRRSHCYSDASKVNNIMTIQRCREEKNEWTTNKRKKKWKKWTAIEINVERIKKNTKNTNSSK